MAFRDPYGIRPLVLGRNVTAAGTEWMVASESVAMDTQGFEVVGDVAPGEAIFIDLERNLSRAPCGPQVTAAPCIFEYVYLARPD